MMAANEALTPEIREDFLTCTFCHLPFNHPKALPCLHTFCKDCLSLHVLKNALPAQDGTSCVHCPTCQQLCDLPPGGVSRLQDNLLMKTILAMINSKMQQVCEPCTDEGQQKHANFCCTKCEEFMCEPHAITHKRTRATKEHLVIDIANMTELCRMVNYDQPGKPVINVRLLIKFGHLGKDLHQPVGLDVNKADEIVVAQGNGTVTIFSSAGEHKKTVNQTSFFEQTEEAEEKESTTDLPNKCTAVTSEGYLAVGMKKVVTKTNPSGQTLTVGAQVAVVQSVAGREIGVCVAKMKNPKECQPHGIAVTNGNHIIVTDIGKHCVYVFDAEYNQIQTFGCKGSRGSKQFKFPYYVTTNPDMDIIVSDYGNHCVKVFDFKSLKCKLKIGSNGNKPGSFLHPMGVCSDRYGNIFVADRDNHRVQMFDPKGQFLAFVLQDTFEKGDDVRPLDIAVTSNSNLVVLLTGVEGVNIAHVCIYQLRSTRVPQEQYRLAKKKQEEELEKKRQEEERRRLEEKEKEKKIEEERLRLELEQKKIELVLEKQKQASTVENITLSNKQKEMAEIQTRSKSKTSSMIAKTETAKKNGGSKTNAEDPDERPLPTLSKHHTVLPPIAGCTVPASLDNIPAKRTVQPDLVLQSLAESIIFDPDKAPLAEKSMANKQSNGTSVTHNTKDHIKSKEKPSSASSKKSDTKKDLSQICVIL